MSYPCPCCGHLVFGEPPGSYEICGICFWEDDELQLRHPTARVGANTVSLIEAQRNYAEFGAMEERFIDSVRPPAEDEPLKHGWRPFDPAIDASDTEAAPVDRMSYFQAIPVEKPDPKSLYYWRREPGGDAADSGG